MNTNESKGLPGTHSVTVKDRCDIALTGIEEVISFDDSTVIMQTSMGQLTLDGSGLNIVKLNLDDGELCVSGKLSGFYYMEQKKSGTGVFSRLFG